MAGIKLNKMCTKVEYYPCIGCVSIDGTDYTKKELEAKNKSQTEISILHTLKGIMKIDNVEEVKIQYGKNYFNNQRKEENLI